MRYCAPIMLADPNLDFQKLWPGTRNLTFVEKAVLDRCLLDDRPPLSALTLYHNLSRSPAPVIIDNSPFYGSDHDFRSMMRMRSQFHHSMLVLPDALGDRNLTIENALVAVAEWEKAASPRPTLIGICQGSNWDEFHDCYRFFLQCPGVDIIGIPFSIDFEVPGSENEFTSDLCPLSEIRSYNGDNIQFKRAVNRAKAIHNLFVDDISLTDHVRFHLFGMANPHELLFYRGRIRRHIYSLDTTLPLLCAYAGMRFISHTEEPVENDVRLYTRESEKPPHLWVDLLREGPISEEVFELFSENVSILYQNWMMYSSKALAARSDL